MTNAVTLLLLTPFIVSSSILRATPYGWILPGGPSVPVAPEWVNMTSADVTSWEAVHADVSFGTPPGYFSNRNSSIGQLGYMYNQMLELTPTAREVWIKDQVDSGRWGGIRQYEDLFLHYAFDTMYDLANGTVSHGSNTMIDGIPWIVGYTASATHAGFSMWQSPMASRHVCRVPFWWCGVHCFLREDLLD
jgi:hypothetical protein